MEFDWTQFWSTILGGQDPSVLLAHLAMAALGAFVYFALDVEHSLRKDPSTPKKFRFWFMVRDNILRGLAVLVAILVILIWFEDWMGTPLNGKLAFTFGLAIDATIGKLTSGVKSFGPFKKSRDALINKYNSI